MRTLILGVLCIALSSCPNAFGWDADRFANKQLVPLAPSPIYQMPQQQPQAWPQQQQPQSIQPWVLPSAPQTITCTPPDIFGNVRCSRY